MDFNTIITLERTRYNVATTTKKSTLELVSQLLAHENAHFSEHEILAKLIERERLGSTSIGYGVAIPHTRMHTLKTPMATLLHLKKPIDFDNNPDQPIDLIFGFIVPETFAEEHLHLISTLATLFNQALFRRKLREASSNEELYHTMISYREEILHGA